MIQLKRVLLPTDFSDCSVEAVRFACALTDQFDSELHLLHVLQSHVSAAPQFGMGLALTNRIQESADAAVERLEAWPDSVTIPMTDRSVIRSTVSGHPFLEIIRYARDTETDLIVMGTHGRSGLNHVLIGSVAERVVRKAPCPVLTVRPSDFEFQSPWDADRTSEPTSGAGPLKPA